MSRIGRFFIVLSCWLLCIALLAGCSYLSDAWNTAIVQTSESEIAAEEISLASSAEPAAESESEGYALAYAADSGWNPYTATSQENRVIFSLLFEGLFEITEDFRAEPLLCADYSVSEDETVYTFRLRKDACFYDGEPVLAKDVLASYAAAEAADVYAGRFRHIVSYEAQDDRTIVITLDCAMGNLPVLLDIPIVKNGIATTPTPIGSGPYKLVLAPLCLQAVDSWWKGADTPFGGSVISLVETTDEESVKDAFETGNISLVCTDPTAGVACVYHSDYELWDCPSTVMVYLGFNGDSELFEDTAARAAITYLIDRERIVTEIYDGFAIAATLPASPLSPAYDIALAAEYAWDPDKFDYEVPESDSGILLVNAGNPVRVEAAQEIADVLNQYGYPLTVRSLGAEAYQEALQKGEYDCYLGEIRLSPDFNLESFFEAGGSAAYGIGAEENASYRNRLMLENEGNAYDLHKLIMEEGYFCPILFKTYAVYCKRGQFSDLAPRPYAVFCIQ